MRKQEIQRRSRGSESQEILVGDKVQKKSKKPFKSGKVINTVSEIVFKKSEFYDFEGLFLRFLEDDSEVQMRTCKKV
jgi:hypothetical protein